jgi:hypothetical protein
MPPNFSDDEDYSSDDIEDNEEQHKNYSKSRPKILLRAIDSILIQG